MYSCILTGQIIGLSCQLVKVEVDASHGLPGFQMVGYLSNEVREAKDRVRVALKNSGFTIPAVSININLSPADIRKEGTAFDLPIAVGILASLGIIDSAHLENTLIIGEIGLNGEIKEISGILPIVRKSVMQGITNIILPKGNELEGSLIPGANPIGFSNLYELFDFLSGEICIPQCPHHLSYDELAKNDSSVSAIDFFDVKSQIAAKRAAVVAAAGFHHMIMIGSPGCGKSMIAQRIPGIMPPLTPDESLEVSSIHSVAGMLDKNSPLIIKRPFMSPHHTVTPNALTGGGKIPKPGLVSLAHRGVLFLDELTEFDRSTLDLLRQPLEDKHIYISRAKGTYKYPANFMLVAACNPCPCGYYPDMNKCKCSDTQIKRYLSKISGPLIDRIDICCSLDPVGIDTLQKRHTSNHQITTREMRESVQVARARQEHRFKNSPHKFNSDMSAQEIDVFCKLEKNEQAMIKSAFEALKLSARSYHRILKVARTIADLDDSEIIKEPHISESILYRTSSSRYLGL